MASLLKINYWLRIAQLILAALTAIFSLAVLATSAHTLNKFQTQRAALNPWYLPLWPEHFNTTNTQVFIGTSTASMVLALVFIIMLCLPRLSMAMRPKLSAVTSVGIAIPVFLLALSAVVFDGIVRSREDAMGQDTIRSWSCKYQGSQAADGTSTSALPDNMSNAAFGGLCAETIFEFAGMVTVMILQVSTVGVAMGQWFSRSDLRNIEEKDSGLDINLGSAKAFL